MYFYLNYILKGQRPSVYLRIVMKQYTTIKANNVAEYKDITKIYFYMNEKGVKMQYIMLPFVCKSGQILPGLMWLSGLSAGL